MPVTSLLVAGRLIVRFGPAPVVGLGILLFATGLAWWAVVPGLEPNLPAALVGMSLLGIGVGLTFPTLMGAGTAALPSSAFATGSGILNMARQTALALGVAVFVAVTGAPETPIARLVAYERAWWLMGRFDARLPPAARAAEVAACERSMRPFTPIAQTGTRSAASRRSVATLQLVSKSSRVSSTS